MVFNYSSVPWMWSYWRTSVVFQWFHHRKANRYRHPPSSSPFYPPSSSSSTPAARPRTLHQLRRRFLRALGGSKSSHHLKNSQHTTRNYKSRNNTDNMKTQSVFLSEELEPLGKSGTSSSSSWRGCWGLGLKTASLEGLKDCLEALLMLGPSPLDLLIFFFFFSPSLKFFFAPIFNEIVFCETETKNGISNKAGCFVLCCVLLSLFLARALERV